MEHTRSPSLRRLPEGSPRKVEPWPPPPSTPWTAGPSLPAGGPPVLHPGAPHGAQKTPPETVASSAHPPASVRRETPQRSRGRVPEPVKQEEDAGRREAPSAPCASPAAGAPGGSGPRGSYCKAQSERLLKMFSGL